MFRVLREALRVLKPKGAAAFHFLPIESFIGDLDNQVAVQFDGANGHHHYYRAPEMLARVLVEGFGATDFSMIKRDGFYWVGVSKGGARRYKSPLLESGLEALEDAVAST